MKTVYYVIAYVFNEEKFKRGFEGNSYDIVPLVSPNEDYDYVFAEYNKLKVDPVNMSLITMWRDDGYYNEKIHMKDEFGEDWDL